MNITVVHGSPRKNGNTYTAARQFMSAMQICGDVTFTEFFLPDALPEFCRGCMICVMSGEDQCPHKAYTLPILDAMLKADALIFTTPVYVMSESGVMKAFLDHFPYLYFVHRPREEMFAKKAFVLSTTLGAGTKSAIKTVSASLRFWGVNRVYSAGFALHEVTWDKIPARRKQKIESRIAQRATAFYGEVASKKRKRPYMFLQIMSIFMRKMAAGYDDDFLDKQYWLQKGWLKKSPFRRGRMR
jgi:multimeric flavodoxin WrbA